MIIHLKNLELYGFHGLYEEEKQIGNWFILNISVQLKTPQTLIVQINETLDYVLLYESVKTIFNQRYDLLETLCQQINTHCLTTFPQIQGITTNIQKKHLNLVGFQGNMIVELYTQRT